MAEEENGSSSSSGVVGLSFFFFVFFVTMWQAVNSDGGGGRVTALLFCCVCSRLMFVKELFARTSFDVCVIRDWDRIMVFPFTKISNFIAGVLGKKKKKSVRCCSASNYQGKGWSSEVSSRRVVVKPANTSLPQHTHTHAHKKKTPFFFFVECGTHSLPELLVVL